MIRILYFGSLKTILGLSEETLEWQGGDSQALLQLLRSRDSKWAEALSEQNIFRLVINHQIIYEPTDIKAGDEVAILPPVTGG